MVMYEKDRCRVVVYLLDRCWHRKDKCQPLTSAGGATLTSAGVATLTSAGVSMNGTELHAGV